MTENAAILRIHFVENYKDDYNRTFEEESEEAHEKGFLRFEPITNNNVILLFICDINELILKHDKLSEYLLKTLEDGYKLISLFPMKHGINIRYPSTITQEQQRGLDQLAAEIILKYNMKNDSV